MAEMTLAYYNREIINPKFDEVAREINHLQQTVSYLKSMIRELELKLSTVSVDNPVYK